MGRNRYLRKRSILDRAAATVRNFFAVLGFAVFLYYIYCNRPGDSIMIYLIDFPITLIKTIVNGT